MSDLRTLLYSIPVAAATNYPQEILIYNTNVNTPANGGRCCQFTVPEGATWILFEIWGGGGGGAGACCCMQGWPGGSGAYVNKTVCSPTLAGCQYTICAGSTTTAACSCIGCAGCTSYVNGYGTSNLCASGGHYGNTTCWLYLSCYTCSTANPYCCCAYGGDVCIHGTQSTYTSSTWCQQYGQQHAPTAPGTVSGPQYGPGGCMNLGNNGNCTAWFPCSVFPGGGGVSAQAYDGSCWPGMHGGNGLVSITYG